MDVTGLHYAQTDYLVDTPSNVLVFECKLSQTHAGINQIVELYRPLVRAVYKKPVIGILTCKNMYFTPWHEIAAPEELIGHTEEKIYTWQWVGR